MSYKTYKVRVYGSGDIHWYLNGNLHREDGPAIESADGEKHWYLNGKRHREDGPASEYADGTRYWFLNGKFHREDGPAIEDADGTKSWYLNNVSLSEEEFNRRRQKDDCEGKMIEFEGKKYKLVPVEQ